MKIKAKLLAVSFNVMQTQIREHTEELEAQVVERTEALAASEAHHRAIVESATDAILSADGQGRITAFNKTAQEMFGYSAEEALGRPLTILMPEQYREAHDAGMARYLQTQAPRVVGSTVELEGRRADGSTFPLQLSLSALTEPDGSTSFTAIIRDITERKEAEAELSSRIKELEEFNRMAVDRELKMIEMKEQINRLSVELGREKKYEIPE